MIAYGNCRGYEYPCDQPLYVKPDPRPAVRERNEAKAMGGANAKRRVKCIETGEVFESLTQASRALGMSLSSASRSYTFRRKVNGKTLVAV